MESSDVLNYMPPEIQQLLKRKSSRDPTSRFATKLHVLLKYVTENPELEDRIGCSWLSDDEFRLNKKAICPVLGIKLNTLNVNLHQLGFEQQKHNKDGWTLWKKPGFTRESNELIESPFTRYKTPPRISLGNVDPADVEQFNQYAKKIWIDLTGIDDVLVPQNSERLINSAATMFKQDEQPFDNAVDVLKAIITPTPQAQITFEHFAKFLAMFGPHGTIMLKIASLLNCSNNTGQWLVFAKNEVPNSLYGSFLDSEPNKLEIRLNGKVIISAWNLPLVDANRQYIRGENGLLYYSWDDFFQKNPVQHSFGLAGFP